MSKLPVLKARELISALEKAGFEFVRQKGSHVRMRHPDGWGLLRKILRDAELTRDAFLTLL
jgi:predicted RNA binding protein YcfA (HicA-like mRNA interferase family)